MPASILSELSSPQANAKHQERWHTVLANDEGDVFVAELGGQVVGFVSSDPTMLKKATWKIYAIYISPDQQRAGIRRKLIDAALSGLEK